MNRRGGSEASDGHKEQLCGWNQKRDEAAAVGRTIVRSMAEGQL